MLDDYPIVRPGAPKPSTIIKPRVFSLPPGTERYVVEGQGAILIPVETGDELTIVNDEGGQRCEVVACDGKGAADAGMHTIWMNSQSAQWPDQQPASRTITNLQQLPGAIRSIATSCA